MLHWGYTSKYVLDEFRPLNLIQDGGIAAIFASCRTNTYTYFDRVLTFELDVDSLVIYVDFDAK